MLNLGCGSRYSKDWVNVDFVSSSPNVIAHNLTIGIPFSDSYFDIVYHSHVLEHFSKEDGILFIKECHRVLKPGGIIRIAVPDLEKYSEKYIASVEALENGGSPENYANHQWAIIELIDQMVRMKSGGEMGKYWQQSEILNSEYIENRVGYEFIQYRKIGCYVRMTKYKI